MAKKKTGYADLDGWASLAEAVSADGGARLDEEAGVIRDMVILTGHKVSKNRTHYGDAALNEAVGRYEGVKMYVDHPSRRELEERNGNRPIDHLGGVFRNVRRTADRVRGDLHVLEGKKPLIFGVAKAAPTGVGFSIRDRGRVKKTGDVMMVEGFDPGFDGYSVDLVTDASVNSSLFESYMNQDGGNDDMDWSKATKEDLKKERPDLFEAVLAEGKSALADEVEALKKKGEEAEGKLLEAQKLQRLADAGYPKEIMEAVRPMIMSKAVSLEEAQGIIAAQKAVAEALKGKGAPAVKGHGASQKVEEGADKGDLPTDDDIVESVRSANSFGAW